MMFKNVVSAKLKIKIVCMLYLVELSFAKVVLFIKYVLSICFTSFATCYIRIQKEEK